jgi:RNA polymerase sigma factor (sigma-70 family)
MQSFEQLESTYRPMIISIIKKLHLTREFDEYYQIGLIALWEASRQFQPEKGTFSSFVYKKVYWNIVSHLRKQWRMKKNECSLTDEFVHILPASLPQHSSNREALQMILRDLTECQKKWLIGYIVENKSLKKIAEEEGVPIGAVKQWRFKALKKLRKKWHLYEHLFL